MIVLPLSHRQGVGRYRERILGSAGRITYQNGIHASGAGLLIKTSEVVSAVAKRRICWNGSLTESCV